MKICPRRLLAFYVQNTLALNCSDSVVLPSLAGRRRYSTRMKISCKVVKSKIQQDDWKLSLPAENFFSAKEVATLKTQTRKWLGNWNLRPFYQLLK